MIGQGGGVRGGGPAARGSQGCGEHPLGLPGG
ncbi:hypothetical protein HMPREF1233_0171, partial [Streptococcus pyogenes GA19700]